MFWNLHSDQRLCLTKITVQLSKNVVMTTSSSTQTNSTKWIQEYSFSDNNNCARGLITKAIPKFPLLVNHGFMIWKQQTVEEYLKKDQMKHHNDFYKNLTY